MLFSYKAIDTGGASRTGSIEALNVDVAIASLQRRGLVVQTIKSDDAKPGDHECGNIPACIY